MKKKILLGVSNHKPKPEIKPMNIPEKKHQKPEKVFEGYVKVNVKKKSKKKK